MNLTFHLDKCLNVVVALIPTLKLELEQWSHLSSLFLDLAFVHFIRSLKNKKLMKQSTCNECKLTLTCAPSVGSGRADAKECALMADRNPAQNLQVA